MIRTLPICRIIEVKSKTTLVEHYRILAKVLNEIRNGDVRLLGLARLLKFFIF